MNLSIAPIVEGDGETQAVPELLRRILHERMKVFDLEVAKPWRVTRSKVMRSGQIENAIQGVTKTRRNVAGILVLLDSDDDCPALVAPVVLSRTEAITKNPVGVVFAHKEFEAWFLGSLESLRGVRGIAEDAVSPDHPESIRGAKELLRKTIVGGKYNPVIDQAALSSKMDLELCRQRCPSFDKLIRDLEHLALRIKERREKPMIAD